MYTGIFLPCASRLNKLERNLIEPLTICPLGACTSCIRESEVTLLPAKESRQIAKENSKAIKYYEKRKKRKCNPDEYTTQMTARMLRISSMGILAMSTTLSSIS